MLFTTLLAITFSLKSFSQHFPIVVAYTGINGTAHTFTGKKTGTKFSLKMDATPADLSEANDPDPAKFFYEKITEKLTGIYGIDQLEIPRIESFALRFGTMASPVKTIIASKRSTVIGYKLLTELPTQQHGFIYSLIDTVGVDAPINILYNSNGAFYQYNNANITANQFVRLHLAEIASFISKNKTVKAPAISLINIAGQDKIYFKNADGSTSTIDITPADAKLMEPGFGAESSTGAAQEPETDEAILSPSTNLVNSVEITCGKSKLFSLSAYSDTGKGVSRLQVELIAGSKKKIYQFNDNISLAEFKRVIFSNPAIKSLGCATGAYGDNAVTSFYYQSFQAFGFYKESLKKTEDPKKDTTKSNIWSNITLLNAANFDFSENVTGTYLAKLNIYAPDIRNTPFGFNAGIMRTRFSNKDSSNSPYIIENRLFKPLDILVQDKTYERQYNRYTSTLSNTAWSFYIQPMLRLVSLPKKIKEKKAKSWAKNSAEPNGIYFHFHAELLVNKTNITTNITTLQRDTVKYDATNPPAQQPFYRPDVLLYDKTYLEGYFGAGLTINLDPFGNDNSRFFLQGTIGITTASPNLATLDLSTISVRIAGTRSSSELRSAYIPNQTSYGFYLVRTHLTQKLTSNAQIVIGTDIRGLFPKYNPVYASYVGLNLNLDALVKSVAK